jgi:S1-C subfamily serine protease
MQDSTSEQDRPEPGSPAGPEKPPADAAGGVADATETAQADQTPQADQSVAAEPAVLAAGSGSVAEAVPDEKPPAAAGEPTAATPQPGWWQRRSRLAMGVGAAGTAVGLAFVAFVAAGGLSGSAQASSTIPSPPRANKMFVEDDNGTGADNQANIVQSAAPGLVHIMSAAGATVGVGMVLTPSGLVLTTDHILGGAKRAHVRTVLTGRRFSAKVRGADSAEDLALLQIEGGSSPFKTVAIGNSRDFAVGAAVTAVGSSGSINSISLDIGNLASLHGAATVRGKRLTGLLESSLQSLPSEETGGPLVNLSGQAIGITVAGSGSGLRSTGFAVPINEALAAAKSIQASHSG